jgi:hypothetical protein
MTPPTPTRPGGLREHTLPILRHTPDGPEPIGECAIRLVLPLRTVDGPQPVDLNAWTITHPLGSVAGGTHTEVAFVDYPHGLLVEDEDGAPYDEQRQEALADSIVRQVAGDVYGPGRWAFHYRPGQYVDAVLAYGSHLRERVEVSSIEVWA